MPAFPGPMLLALAVVCSGPGVVMGQTFDLSKLAVPGAYTFSLHQLFHVYGKEQSDVVAPGSSAVAKVVFNGVAMKLKDDSNPEFDAYGDRMQVGLVPYNKIHQLINTTSFCSTKGLELNSVPGVTPNLIKVSSSAQHSEFELSETGVYVAVVANCGEVDTGIVMDGSITVHSPWGYLPVTEFYKESFYGIMAAVYSCVSLAWLVLSLRWWRQLQTFQKGLAAVALMGVLEATLWWIFYLTWNSSGEANRMLFSIALLVSAGKMLVSIGTLFSLQLCSDDFRPGDSCCERADAVLPMKVYIVMMLFMVLQFNSGVGSHFRYTLAIKLPTLMMSQAPTLMTAAALGVWVFVKLSGTVEGMKDKESEVAQLVKRMQGLLMAVLLMGAGASILRLFDPTMQEDASMWKYHFIVSDAVLQFIFLLGLLIAMACSIPHEGLQGVEYMPQQQVEGGMIGAPAVIWDNDDDDALGETERGAVE